MSSDQRAAIEGVFDDLDWAGEDLLQPSLDSVPGIEEARDAINEACALLKGILQRKTAA